MTIQYMVSNGEVLNWALYIVGFHSDGRHEFDTTSVNEIVRWVCERLDEERGIRLTPDDANLTVEKLQKSVVYLVAQMKTAEILTDWQGEVVRKKRDPERLCRKNGYDSYVLLDTFAQLVKEQTEVPEISCHESLFHHRSRVQKALTVKDKDLERLTCIVEQDLDIQTWEEPFALMSSREQLLFACNQFVKTILLVRERQIDGTVDLLLRAQMVFVHNRALWWTVTVNNFVTQYKALKQKIRRKRGTAAEIFLEETERQNELTKAVKAFNKQTKNCLAQFVEFNWLNEPFEQPWGES